jgi:hypothetical protein
MIPYVEIIRETADGSLKTFSFIEPSECWFELKYHGFGEFELYCPATQKNLTALKKGYYVKIPNRRFGWCITSIQYEFTAERGVRMVSAKGLELKWLLKKRIIQKQIQLPTDLFQAVHELVNANIGEGATEARKIPFFKSVRNSEVITIPETQAPRGNLGEYVDTLLNAHSCGSTAFFNKGRGNTHEIHFEAYKGQNKANSVRFSQSLDNLLSSTYYSTDEDVGSFSLVVSQEEIKTNVNEEEVTQDLEVWTEVDKGQKGSKRSEILIESNLSTKYADASGEEKELNLANEADLTTFKIWQEEEGKSKLAEHKTLESVSGEIDLQNSLYTFDERLLFGEVQKEEEVFKFFLGDMVRVQDEYFDFYLDTRISKVTIKQDSSGYGEEIEYNE